MLRRKSNEDRLRHSITDGGGWGLYLTFEPFLLSPIKMASPTRAAITPAQAEAIIAQDTRFKSFGLTFGCWQGDSFVEGLKFNIPDSNDMLYQSPDGLHSLRLKCPPTKPYVIPNLNQNVDMASFAKEYQAEHDKAQPR